MTYLILTFICISTAFLTYRKETVGKISKKKKRVIKLIFIISIIGFIVNPIIQYINSRETSNNYNKLNSNYNTIIKENLKSKNTINKILQQNDSLLIVISILNNEIKESRNELIKLNYSTKIGFISNTESIDKIGKISTQNYLTNEDKNNLNTILSKNPGKACFEFVNEDPECNKYTMQLRDLFRKAKWTTNNKFNRNLYDAPFDGIHICINKDKEFPKGLYNIMEAFDKIKVKYKMLYNNDGSRLDDWIYIEIGSLR